MSVKLTTAYWKIKSLKNKIKIIQGGQGAGKTYSISTILFELSINNPFQLSTIVTDTYTRLRDGVIYDMNNICRNAGLNFDKNYNKQEKNLYFNNNSLIQFRNVDQHNLDAGKGPRRNNLFINEGNRVGWGPIEQIWNRTFDNIYVDYNPDREFWYHEKTKDGIIQYHDFISLTYLDNEMMMPGELELILMKKKRYEIIMSKKEKGEKITQSEANEILWWQIYGLGELGVYSDRQIYSYEIIKDIPITAKKIFSGMDFGLSPDPTTLVDNYIDGSDLICDEIFTENNLEAEKIKGSNRMSVVDKMQEIAYKKGQMIFGDSANKRNILDLRRNGYNIQGVEKYKGSIIDGIKIIKGYNLKITERSINIKKGCESWFYKVDENNKIIPEPDGHEPDTLAAIRYAMLMYNKRPSFTI